MLILIRSRFGFRQMNQHRDLNLLALAKKAIRAEHDEAAGIGHA